MMKILIKASPAATFSPLAQTESAKVPAGDTPLLAHGDLVQIDERPSAAHTHSIPQPRFRRRLPTVEFPPLVDEAYARKFTVEQPIDYVSELRFDKFSPPSTFNEWKTNSKTEVCSGSPTGSSAMDQRNLATSFKRLDRFLDDIIRISKSLSQRSPEH